MIEWRNVGDKGALEEEQKFEQPQFSDQKKNSSLNKEWYIELALKGWCLAMGGCW